MMLSSGDGVLSYVPRPPAVTTVNQLWKPNVEMAPNCPRCASSNTKFCYYNNYSLSQPRYFCKSCRRYWTKGGSLRNVPVGGGCRKSRRGKSMRVPSEEGGGHRPSPGPIRPDLALDEMVSNSCTVPDMTSTASHDTIDLSVLYAKYLNQCPEPEPPADVVMELAGEFEHEHLGSAGRSTLNLSGQDSGQLAQPKLVECQRLPQLTGEEILINANWPYVEQIDSFVDPSINGFESLATPMDYNYFPSECLIVPHLMSEEIGYRDLGSLASLHQSYMNSEWSTLDDPSMETLYRS